VQPGSTGTSDYLRYTGNIRHAYMRGGVNLTDNKDNLWSEEVNYDLNTKTGTYSNDGTLQSGATTVSSRNGIYNLKSKDARFTGNVIVTDPEYHIRSEDLGYHTESKVVTFYSPSVVTSDSSVLKTSCGTYDTKNEIAHFTCRSSILNKEQYLEADSIDYNRKTGGGLATGKVIAIDTTQHTTLYSGRADYNEKRRTMLATIKPVMKQMSGKDSLFIRADTLYSAPIPKAGDTIKVVTEVLNKGAGKNGRDVVTVQEVDSIAVDSNRPRQVIGYHHVLIFSDSLQGRCDSISYSQQDSVIKMMYDPIVWSRNSQITGDTILLRMDSSNELREIYVPNNALVVSQSGPPQAGLFDQIQGKMLTGYLDSNTITETWVRPDVETIYYSKDESEAYLGVNQATSEQMRIYFKNQEIDRIYFEKDVKQKMTPMEQADLPNTKLSRFKWLIDKRPKSLKELFE
jgi:lipopolysaccharide export system protein LptA